MAILIRFSLYTLFCFYCLWTSSRVEGTKEKILLKEPDEQWTEWNVFGNWILDGKRYVVCGAGGSDPNKIDWLLSPFISLPPSVTNVQVKMEYNIRSCDTLAPPCKIKMTLLMKDQNAKLPVPNLQNDPLTKIGTETPDRAKLTNGKPAASDAKITSVFTANVRKNGLFIAVRVQTLCMALFSFEVSYRVCASEGINLMTFPKTVSPAIGSPKVNVTGTCVDHALPLPSQPSTLYAFCDSNGNWSVDADVSCVCMAGYQRNVLLNTCEVCTNDTFKERNGLESCIRCPLHSSPETPPVQCKCDMGYYRNTKEVNCTSIPSAPIDVKASHINASSTRLEWKEPEDLGGRTDLSYEVECKKGQDDCDSNVRFFPNSSGLTQNHVFIANLKPHTSYSFQVFSKNGVSAVAGKANYTEIHLTTKESTPGKPTDVKVTRGEDLKTAHVQWTLEEKYSRVSYYEVIYYNLDSGSSGKVNSTYTNITIYGLDPDSDYSFQVRARTSAGFGPYSTEIVSKKEDSPYGNLALYVGIGIGAVVLLLVILIVVLFCRRRNSGSAKGAEYGMEMLPIGTDGQRLYIDPSSYGSMLAALHNFASEIDKTYVKLQERIGGGEFGEVHKGTLTLPEEKPEAVAVKSLRNDVTLKSRDDFLSEAAIMGQFDHPNVIQMKGVVTKSVPMMIITEFMENGSLENFLQANVGQLTNLQLIGMARGVASGMEYLAEMNFIHRDLAARNILVAENMACKVADFGLSRELESDSPDSEYMTQGGKIAVRWTALEAIKYRKFSSASDVWSFGILFWEIMTFGERPYWDWTNFQVMDQIEAGYRLSSPVNCPKVIHNMMLECWVVDKTRRPRFSEIVKRLDELIRSPDLLRDDMIDRVNRKTVDYESIETVEELLKSINMGKYTSNFKQAGYVDLGQLVDIGESDLDRVGVKLAGHRNKIKKSIKGLKDFLIRNSVAPSC